MTTIPSSIRAEAERLAKQIFNDPDARPQRMRIYGRILHLRVYPNAVSYIAQALQERDDAAKADTVMEDMLQSALKNRNDEVESLKNIIVANHSTLADNTETLRNAVVANNRLLEDLASMKAEADMWKKEAERLSDALALSARAYAWQTMDTAPKDGREFIAFSKERGIRIDCSSRRYLSTGLFYDQRPGEVYTHWMPLPLPPAAKGE